MTSFNDLFQKKKLVALILAKGNSKRLPGKNLKEFRGKPTFLWNVEKCLNIFDEVYVSSDSEEILSLAEKWGANPIKRGEELCGDTPDIPVYLHAAEHFHYPDEVMGVVAVHANNPTIHPTLIARVKYLLEIGAPEVMTCYPMSKSKDYHKQANKIYGSIRGISIGRLKNYDPLHPNPEILLVDTSVEIETPKSWNEALKQHDRYFGHHNES